jgi:hypothetical protein
MLTRLPVFCPKPALPKVICLKSRRFAPADRQVVCSNGWAAIKYQRNNLYRSSSTDTM